MRGRGRARLTDMHGQPEVPSTPIGLFAMQRRRQLSSRELRAYGLVNDPGCDHTNEKNR
jgi:hypothetical protein